MKTTLFMSVCPSFRVVPVVLAFLMSTGVSVRAGIRYWDGPNSGGVGDEISDGGTGTWDTVTLNWDQENGVDRTSWVNGNNDTAIFGGAVGTVTLGTGITVGGLQFDTAGYIVQSLTNTFGVSGDIAVNADARINSVIAAAPGATVTKTGSATLTVGGGNTFTNFIISQGTVKLALGGSLGGPNLTLAGGAVLDVAGFGPGFQYLSGSGLITNSSVSPASMTWAATIISANDVAIDDTDGGPINVAIGQGHFVTFSNTAQRFRGPVNIANGAAVIYTLGNTNAGSFGTGDISMGNGATLPTLAYLGSADAFANGRSINIYGGASGGGAAIDSSGGGTLTMGGAYISSAAAVSKTLILQGTNTGANTMAGVIANTNGVGANATNVLHVTKSGSGTWVLAGANTYTGVTTVSAGTLKAGTSSVANVSGAFGLNSTVTNANTVGAVLDLNGFDNQIGSLAGGGATGGNVVLGAATLTISGNNNNPATFAGVISGSGGLIKNGLGKQTLSGTNTYNGSTTVNAGKLFGASGGSCSNSAVTVASGATIGARVATAAGQWTCAALTLSSGTTTAEFDFAVTPSMSVAPLQINGNFINNGTLNVAMTNGTFLKGLTYPLIRYTGSLTIGTLGTLTLPAGVVGTLVNNTANKSIDLNVTAGNGLVWSAGTGTWDINVSSNWNGQTAKYTDGSAVQFDDTPAGVGPFLVYVSNAVSPGAVSVFNETKAYTFASNSIAGSGTLVKSGAGTLTLSNQNSYSGGTIVNGGTLSLGCPFDANVGTIRGTLTVNSGATVTSTVQNALGIGVGVSVLNINTGKVDLSFGQIHLWGTAVNMSGGTLKFSSNGANEMFNTVFTINSSASQAQILAVSNGAMRIRNSSPITFNVADGAQAVDLLVDVPITTAGDIGLYKNGAGAMELTKANGYGGPTTISGGTLLMNGSHSGGASYTVTVAGALSGTGTIASAVTVDGVIAPGNGGIGKLTVGNVKWAAGPAWSFELGAASTSDRLAINGGFTNNGGPGFTFDFQNTGVAGVYTLVTWTASTSFTNTDFSANNLPGGLTPAFIMNANSLMLSLSGGSGGITAEATNSTTAVVGGQFTFGFNIASGALYHVQASTNLLLATDNGFTNITGQLTNNGAATITYTNTTSDPVRMFRISSP